MADSREKSLTDGRGESIQTQKGWHVMKTGKSILIGVSVIVLLAGCGVPKKDHEDLQMKYEQQNKLNEGLIEKNKELGKQVGRLTAKNRQLMMDYQRILLRNKELEGAESAVPNMPMNE